MSKSLTMTVATAAMFLGGTCSPAVEPYRIEVIDSANQWPVPLVELRTTHNVRFVTDNAGVVAFDLPELMGVETWLFVEGHGYAVEKDGFGYRGIRVTPRPGETITIEVERQLPARRLGRITGGGMFAESQKLGEQLDWQEQGILGCDSVQNVIHNGRLFWAWGDTTLPNYPLGLFHMTGATTSLKPLSSFEPPIKLRYDYFVNSKNVPVGIAEMPGEGPTWLSGFASLKDASGNQRLVATYSKIRAPMVEYQRGLCVWNETTKKFENFKSLWTQSEEKPQPPATPLGHPVQQTDKSGQSWILFGDPFPTLKCVATFEDWANPKRWHKLEPQESVPAKGSNGRIRPHRGAIAWNGFRNCWVSIFTQLDGDSSYIGELWYAESDAPEGPWRNAIKVVTHNNYSFYNPQLHPEFTDANSPVLLFEATYTHTFSETASPTPRHDYNQVLYRLDLDSL